MKKPRVLIFGATGFVGRNVWELLRQSGWEVHGLSRTAGCDLLDMGSVWRAVEPIRPDYLVNCAAFVGSVDFVSDFAADVVDQNMRMLLNLYKIAQQMHETVVVNPVANCGFPGDLDTYREKDFWAGPIHPSVLSYGSTRRMIEVLSKCYHQQYGVRSANLFVPNMYGPYDSTNPIKTHALNALVIKFVQAVKSGAKEVEVWGTGKPVREWLYVRDFARVVKQVIEERTCVLDPVSVAQNHGLTVDELVAIIAGSVGLRGRIVKNLKYADGAPRKVMDDALFRQRFKGFRFTSFKHGLKETIDYYRKIL